MQLCFIRFCASPCVRFGLSLLLRLEGPGLSIKGFSAYSRLGETMTPQSETNLALLQFPALSWRGE